MALGQWGPAVIGEEQYEKEKKIIETSSHVYGPGVLSTEEVRHVSLPALEPHGEAVTSPEPVESSGPGLQGPPAATEPEDVPPGWMLEVVGGGRYRVHMPSGEVLGRTFKGRAAGVKAIRGIVEGIHESIAALEQQELEAGATHEPEPEEPEPADVKDAGAVETKDPVRPEPEFTLEAIAAAVEESDGSDANLSIDDLTKMLEGRPEVVGRQFAGEMNRPEGRPRKGALDAILGAELLREGGPRAAMQAAIETALAELQQE